MNTNLGIISLMGWVLIIPHIQGQGVIDFLFDGLDEASATQGSSGGGAQVAESERQGSGHQVAPFGLPQEEESGSRAPGNEDQTLPKCRKSIIIAIVFAVQQD